MKNPNNNFRSIFAKMAFVALAFTFTNTALAGNDHGGKKATKMATAKTELPQFMKSLYAYLEKHLSYPADCAKKNVQGKTYVKLTLQEDGSISHLEVVKSAHQQLDQEAIRVIQSMPNWKPQKTAANAAQVAYTIPINFEIQ